VKKGSGRPAGPGLGVSRALSGHMPGDSPDPLTGPLAGRTRYLQEIAPRTTRQIDHGKVKNDAHTP